MIQKRRLLGGTAIALGLGAALLPEAGQAQVAGGTPPTAAEQAPTVTGQPAAVPSGSGAQADIVVTGSRVARSGFSQPTPTVVVGPAFLAQTAAPNVADALNLLPQLRSSITPATGTATVASAGKNILDLRGLGAQRTLTLVDGKRFVPGILEGPVDTNAIPQALIENIDIVTGGASAAYGSDAVSGVVNLRLLKHLDGVKATFQGGITDHNDFRNYLASVAVGETFAEGRGQIIVSGEAAQNSGVKSIYNRDWSAARRGQIANPAYTATNAEPASLLVNSGAAFSNSSYGGVINSGPLKGIQFGQGGTPLPFNYGTLTTSRNQLGGDGAYVANNLYLAVPTRRRVVFGHLGYDVADAFKPYVEGSYADSRATAVSNTREDTAITIRNDNPFLPASIKTAMATKGITSFTMGRFSSDYGSVKVPSVTKTWRIVAGATGDIGGGWSYDAYYTHGDTDSRQSPQGVRVTANYNFAVDAITDPTTGAAVCRNVAARAAGCVPINLFGAGSPSAQSVSYITANSYRDAHLTQDVGSVTLRGNPISTWAGPVSIAVGGELRRDAVDFDISALAQNFALATGNGLPWSGHVNVKEAFAEAVVPLAKDVSFARSIDLDLAGRVTDYSTSGTVETWKAGASWAVNDIIRFRGTISRDIKAPSLADLFAAGLSNIFNYYDPLLNQTYQMRTVTSGTSDLKPEKATTKTVGVVIEKLVPGLRFSVDYYDIRIRDAIATLSGDAIVRRCLTDTPSLCSLVTRDATTRQVTNINIVPRNLQTIHENGLDIEADYGFRFIGGRLSFHADVNYIHTLSYQDAANTIRLDGSVYSPFTIGTNGLPNWRGFFSANYEVGPLSLYGDIRYIGPANINNSFTNKDLNVLRVPSIAYVDAAVTYKVIASGSRKVEAFFHVNNLLDKDPPLTDGTFGTTATIYDVIGRTYSAGIRVSF